MAESVPTMESSDEEVNSYFLIPNIIIEMKEYM